MLLPAVHAEMPFSVGSVGPVGQCGTLSPSASEPVMPTRIQYSSIVELVGPLGPVEMLLPGEHVPGLCPIGLTVGLLPVAAVPLPAVRDPMIALSPVEGLERYCAEVGEESITVHGGCLGLVRTLLEPLSWLLWWEWMPCRFEMMLRWIVQTGAQPGMVVVSVRWLMA